MGIDFTACTMLPTTADGTPLCRCPSCAPSRTPGSSCGSITPPSRRPTEINARRRGTGARRGCRATAARSRPSGSSPRRCRSCDEAPEVYARRRPAHRGGRLGRLAADRRRDAQQLHRRLQGASGRRATASRRRTSSRRSIRASRTWSTRSMSRDIQRRSASGRRTYGERPPAGPACSPARRSPSPTSTRMCRCPRSA